MDTIKRWSFSMLMKYETCPMRVRLQYIERLPEPPPPPTSPLERGNREHKRLEHFVTGVAPQLVGCEATHTEDFLPALKHARTLFEADQATAEQAWYFDADWNPCAREGAWLTAILDLNVQDEERQLVIPVDFKTGKSQYKAVEHVQQTQFYSGLAALKFEWADTIAPELWYLDEGHIRASTYTREQALMYVGRFNQRAQAMFSDTLFRPRPSKMACRYCPYSPRGTGACPVGV